MSIHKRADTTASPWQVKWRERGRQRSRSFATRREAVLFEGDVMRHLQLGNAPAPLASTVRVAEWAETWLRVHGPQWAPSTLEGRGLYMRRWVVPYLGDFALGELTRGTIQRWRTAMLRDGGTNSTVNHATRVLSAALTAAVEDDLMPGNPALGLRSLRHRVERPRALEAHEVYALLAAAGDRDRRLIALMAFAGLRPGEALALRWEDVGERIHVHRSVRLDGSISTPKSGKGRTTKLLLDPHAVGLAEHGDGIVAPAAHGGVLNYRGWYRNSWKRIRERAGVACTPYDLRHTFASRRIAEGASVVEVAAEMGHADPALTLRRYAHLFDSRAS